MRWFGWFRGAAYEGGALSNPEEGNQAARPEPRTTSAKINVTDERAMQVSTVFACTRLIAQTCAALPLGLYERTPDGRKPMPEDHPVWELMKYEPNKDMTALDFRHAMYAQRVLWGNGYAHIKWMGNNPVSVKPMRPEFMTPFRDGGEVKYRYNTDNGVEEFKAKDIFHLRGWSPDGLVGVSALGYAREALGLSVVADQSAAKSVDGTARAVLELDDYPTDKQKERIRQMYGNNRTVEFSDGLAIIPGGMKYRAISIPPDDLQLLESRQFQVPEICRFFGVPSVLVDGASSTSAWPASYEQQMQQFLGLTIKPYLDEFEDKVSASFMTRDERRKYYAEHNIEGLLRADSAGRSAFYSSGLQNGWLTVNEVRMRENLPKSDDPGADQLHAQVNLAPLGELGEGNENVA